MTVTATATASLGDDASWCPSYVQGGVRHGGGKTILPVVLLFAHGATLRRFLTLLGQTTYICSPVLGTKHSNSKWFVPETELTAALKGLTRKHQNYQPLFLSVSSNSRRGSSYNSSWTAATRVELEYNETINNKQWQRCLYGATYVYGSYCYECRCCVDCYVCYLRRTIVNTPSRTYGIHKNLYI